MNKLNTFNDKWYNQLFYINRRACSSETINTSRKLQTMCIDMMIYILADKHMLCRIKPTRVDIRKVNVT